MSRIPNNGVYRLLSCLGLALAAMAGCNVLIALDLDRAEQDFDLALPFEGVVTLDVEWSNGRVEVGIDDSADHILADGTIIALGRNQQAAEDALEEVDILLRAASADTAELTYTIGGLSEANVAVNIAVTLPAGVELRINSSNGDVVVTGNAGSINVDLSNGAVIVDDCDGQLGVEVSNGSVDVTGHAGDVAVRISNGGAEIASRDGDVTVEVSNGSIDVEASPAEAGIIDLAAGVGGIHLEVPAEFAASLDLDAGLGPVTADLAAFTVTNLQSRSNRLTAILNGGGGAIRAETETGSIRFSDLE